MTPRWLAALMLVLAGSGVHAQPVDDLQRDDSLALSIAWRLQTANAEMCARAVPATGVLLQDAAVHADPGAARETYGLTGDIYIGALAQGGPGNAAGLAVNMGVTAIDGRAPADLPLPPRDDPFARWRMVQALLDQAAARDGAVTLTTTPGRTVRLVGVPACPGLVRVDDGAGYAEATRDDIRLGRRLFDAAQGDTDLIAALVAHELAHAVLDHQTQIAASHHALAVVRRTEREADRLSVWLLARAGYPPQAAVRLQRGLIARLGGWLPIDPTHGSWRARAKAIADEITALQAAPDLDWARRFRRES